MRTRAADDYDFINKKMREIKGESVSDSVSTDLEKMPTPTIDFMVDFMPNGDFVLRPLTARATHRAINWTPHSDGTFRRLKPSMEDKLRQEGYIVSRR